MSGLADLDAVHENPLTVSRRLIYLHRLVGDDVLTPKAKTVRPNPWRVTIIFFLYAVSATMSILTYVDVSTLSSINMAIEETLTQTPFKIVRGVEKFAKDVEEANDIAQFILNSMVTNFIYGYVDEYPGAVRKNNRILSTGGFCANTSILFVTVRRVKFDQDSRMTTGSRFSRLYPKTWLGPGIEAGQEANMQQENTSDFWGHYAHPLSGSSNAIPEAALGYDKYMGKPITYERLSTSRGLLHVWAKWKWSSPCHEEGCGFDGGLASAGGYSAAIVLQKTHAHQEKINKLKEEGSEVQWHDIREIAEDMFVYLLDKDSPPITNTDVGTCSHGIKATQILTLAEFINMGVFDRYCTSASVHFQTYNAETQVISEVELKWNILQAGIVSSPFLVRTRSVKMDMRVGFYVAFEIIYILGCVFYFVELFVYKLYKYGRKLFSDVWTYVNMLSIICSILSVAFRFQFGASNKAFLQDSATFALETANLVEEIRKENNVSILYQIFSALALITIWLRVVELLAKTPPRVKLLETTLIKALSSMVAYFCYIMVILVGFWAFASVHFAAYSLEFSNPAKAFISCFQLLCLNLLPYQTTHGAPLRIMFFFPYMFFSIISVQMFNSIINYAYNRTSDEMEPILKQQKDEQQALAKTQKSAMKRAYLLCKRCCSWLQAKCWKPPSKDEEEVLEPASVGKKDALRQPKLEELSQADKDMVQEDRAEEICRKNANEKCFPMFLYGAFALCYILFLGISLQIQSNGQITHAIAELIYDTPFEVLHATGSSHHRTFKEINSMHDADLWISTALPHIIFQGSTSTRKSPQDATFYDNTTHCLQNWNCLVKGRNASSASSAYKSVRITERLYKKIPNSGTDDMKEHSDDLPGTRFQMGGKISPTRGPKDIIEAADSPTENEDTVSEKNLYYKGRRFCQRQSGQGYMRNGGIVCLLDSDRRNMTKQLEVMRKQDFYSSSMAAVVVDFVTYNANTNSMVLVALKFVAAPSGGLEASAETNAFSLLNIKNPENHDYSFGKLLLLFIEAAFSVDMACGIIYMALVVYFVIRMMRDIYQEMIKANFYDGTHWSETLVNFFTNDLFHTLDLFSYVVSAISFALFIVWLAMQIELKEKAEGDIDEFLSYVEELQGRRRLYKLLSSCNLLTICVRPLKFFRNDPRMAKLNMTFHHAKVDIMWFIVMLVFFMAGFVLFAHIIFGIHMKQLNTVLGSCVYCFKFLIGSFNFWELWFVNGFFAMFFVFSFLFLFKFFFLNIFFAILDKNFVTGEAAPMNLRRLFKPIFGRIIRKIDWDADLNMESESAKTRRNGPPSRADKVHKFAEKIAEEVNKHSAKDESGTVKKSKALNDVCDCDDRMNDVLRWSREEAKQFIQGFRELLHAKHQANNEEVFLRTVVKNGRIDADLKREKERMNQAERMHRYAILVNEKMAERDQEILSKYILRLEYKMKEKMKAYKSLNVDVHHLMSEAEYMQYPPEQLKHVTEPHQAIHAPEETTAPLAIENIGGRNDTEEDEEQEEAGDEEAKGDNTGGGDITNGGLQESLTTFLEENAT